MSLQADLANRKAAAALETSERFARATIDALSAHIAILDETGLIMLVNRSWREYAEANHQSFSTVCEGANYLTVCDTAEGPDKEQAAMVAASIRAVLRGEQHELSMEYPCHSPDEKRWFIIRATRFSSECSIRVVVAHENNTERKIAEEALVESEMRHRHLLESAGMGIGYYNADGVLLLLNNIGARNLGRRSDELIGKSMVELFGEKAGSLFQKRIREVAAEGHTKAYEDSVQLPAGERWFLSSYAPIRNDHGLVEGVQVISHDIIERKSVEKEINRMAMLLDAAPNAITVYDFEGNCLYANHRTFQMHGFSPEEYLAINLHQLDTPESEKLIAPRMTELLESGDGTFEEFHNRKDGSTLPLEVHAQIIEWGTTKGILSIATDITERKKVHELLLASENRFRNLFLKSPVGICITNSECRFINVNEALCRMLDYSRGELLGLTVFDVTHPEDIDQFRSMFEDVISGVSAGYQTEKRFVNKDGTVLWVKVTTAPVTSSDGAFNYGIGIVEDISNRKRIEEALRESQERFLQMFEHSHDLLTVANEHGKILWANPAWQSTIGYTEETLGDPYEKIHPEDRPRILEAIQSLNHDASAVTNIEYRYRNIQGDYLYLETTLRKVIVAGRLLVFEATRDITERRRSEESLRQSEERFRHISSTISDISYSCVTDDFGNYSIDWMTGAVERITGYSLDEIKAKRCWSTLVVHEDLDLFHKHVTELAPGISDSCELRMRHKNGEIVWVASYAECVKSQGPQERFYIYGGLVDINERKRTEQLINRSKKQLEQFYQHLVEAVENERARISREIHDELGQSLTALKIDMNWLQDHVSLTSEIETKLARMIDIVNNTIRDVQEIASNLRPDLLEDLGLIPAIEWYCEEFEKRTGIRCDKDLEEIQSFNMQLNLTLFRVTQEALTNVVRHANGTIVQVNLRRWKNNLFLEIIDNGIGIDVSVIDSHKSLGIIGMRERLRQFNGTVKITNLHPKGTSVTVLVPVGRKQ